jgi:hypothetical protein
MRDFLPNRSLALGLLASAAFAGPSAAVEASVETPAWPELLAPRPDIPDSLIDDQIIVEISPEGKPVIATPEIVTGAPNG